MEILNYREWLEEIVIEDMTDEEILDMYSYDIIQLNTEENFNELMRGKEPWGVMRSIKLGEYCSNDKYVMLDGYDNLKSFNNLWTEMDVDYLLDALVDSDYKSREYTSYLNEMDEEEEETGE